MVGVEVAEPPEPERTPECSYSNVRYRDPTSRPGMTGMGPERPGSFRPRLAAIPGRTPDNQNVNRER